MAKQTNTVREWRLLADDDLDAAWQKRFAFEEHFFVVNLVFYNRLQQYYVLIQEMNKNNII